MFCVQVFTECFDALTSFCVLQLTWDNPLIDLKISAVSQRLQIFTVIFLLVDSFSYRITVENFTKIFPATFTLDQELGRVGILLESEKDTGESAELSEYYTSFGRLQGIFGCANHSQLL